MGKLLPSWRQALIDEMVTNIESNTSHYYAFAGLSYNESSANTDYVNLFNTGWNLLFGKKLANTDIIPVIKNNSWVSNTVYDRYDNTSNTLHTDGNFYVISPPPQIGGSYNVYKCIDNANGATSTVQPVLVQPTTFQTSDGYKWRYLTSIQYKDYITLSTTNYTPVYVNPTISASAQTYSGVEVVMIQNSGNGYSTHHDGIIRSIVNTTVVEIETSASLDNDFYTNSSIYIYNTSQATSQLFGISQYVSNTAGRWVYLDAPANTTNITPSITQYKISPKVVFTTDGSSDPVAYSIVNTTSNSISNVVILDSGANITWANVAIQCNTSYGSGINVYAIVPPPGGHGQNPVAELDVKGISLNFVFANTESNTIVTSNVAYDMIGILKNPYVSNNTSFAKGDRYTSNTFNQVLKANVGLTFTTGELVTGANSGALGKVVFSNATMIYLIGDKYFQNGESVIAANGATTALVINTHPQVYSKDLIPMYIQNINSINRLDTQSESYSLIIQF